MVQEGSKGLKNVSRRFKEFQEGLRIKGARRFKKAQDGSRRIKKVQAGSRRFKNKGC